MRFGKGPGPGPGSGSGSGNLPPAKRITTPAGQRLSVILENSGNAPPPYSVHSSPPVGQAVTTGDGEVVQQQVTTLADGAAVTAPPPAATGADGRPRGKPFALLGIGPNGRNSFNSTNSRSFFHSDTASAASGPYYDAEQHIDSPPTLVEKFSGRVRDRRSAMSSRRGGWRRLLIMLLVILIVLAVALGVGLGVGLKNHSDDGSSGGSSGSSASSGSGNGEQQVFPAGSWAVETFLDTVLTDCTTESSTWRCYPYQTYDESPDSSSATFNWIIEKTGGGEGLSGEYSIRSTQNPFGIVFPATPLQLQGQGTSHEKFVFKFDTSKQVFPNTTLTNSDATTICVFPKTSFLATLFTNQDTSYTAAGLQSIGTTEFKRWPNRATVEQMATSDDGGPNCHRSVDQHPTGPLLDIPPVTDGVGLCDCYYKNWLDGS